MTKPLDEQPPIAFRPLTFADFGLLRRWLRAPHVRAWWGDALDTTEQIAAEYGPCVTGADPTRVFLILLADRPVGFIQHYRMSDSPAWERSVAIPRAAGIDYLLGEPEVCGRGIGSRAIARFSTLVFDAYPDLDAIVAAPQDANRASCRALEKAGYALVGVRYLDSDDPSDADLSAIYELHRPLAGPRVGGV